MTRWMAFGGCILEVLPADRVINWARRGPSMLGWVSVKRCPKIRKLETSPCPGVEEFQYEVNLSMK